MNDYQKACDALLNAVGGTLDERNLSQLTTDQQLKAAEVAALLSISQQLSGIRHGEVAPEHHGLGPAPRE